MRRIVLQQTRRVQWTGRRQEGVEIERTFAVQHRNVIRRQTDFGLNADEQRAAATCRHTLPGKVNALKAQRKGTFLQIFI